MAERAMRDETLAVKGGAERFPWPSSAVFPLFQSTVYTVDPGLAYEDIPYIRVSSTPTQLHVQSRLAALEGAEAGLVTASGMAALATTLLAELGSGDHLIAPHGLYGGTHVLLTRYARERGWSYTFVDPREPADWKRALRAETKLFLLETISNPLMRVPALGEVARFCREHGLLSLIDNTFATPMNFRPLERGFDLVVHSATKYLNGHDDIAAGCVLGGRERIERIRGVLSHFGGCLDPHAAFLLDRGLKTLALRVAAQNRNGFALARALAQHGRVAEVNYPGLESHPDHATAREFLRGFGGMLSFRLAKGVAAKALFEGLRLAYPAPSLGGVGTLVMVPAATSHRGLGEEERRALGITEDLVRVSCGVEHPEDIVEDFRQALDAA